MRVRSERHSQRQGDSTGPEAPASDYTQMTYNGVTITYLKDKIKQTRSSLLWQKSDSHNTAKPHAENFGMRLSA